MNATAAARVVTAVVRMEQGNFSNVKGIGGGDLECRIDFGPGYRVYFGRDGDRIVILLGEVRRNVRRRTLRSPRHFGKNTKNENVRRYENGTHKGF